MQETMKEAGETGSLAQMPIDDRLQVISRASLAFARHYPKQSKFMENPFRCRVNFVLALKVLDCIDTTLR